MPELPEVQAQAERLDAALARAVLSRFEALAFTALKTYEPRPEASHGAVLESVGRRGKLVVLRFAPVGDGPATAHVVHLMQGGRLVPDAKQARRPRGGQARWVFDEGRALLLTEAGSERRAGVWVVGGEPHDQEPLAGLGPDADTVDADRLSELWAAHNMRLHGFLRDQHRIAGLGRRLANEVCHRAGLSPFAMTAKLDRDRAAAVVTAICDAVAEGLAFERARDAMSSSAERPGRVHHRTGEPCPTCGDPVREVAYTDYTVNYCATCQTGGKVLADNTTSKFLR